MNVAALTEIRAIYVSKGHDFYGRHGMERLEHEVDRPESVECVAGKGLVGDRFFDYKENFKGQITFFSQEIADSLQEKLGISELDCSSFRRNVILSGVDLNSLIGKRFELQGVVFEGSEESKPCHWMDKAVGPGSWDFLKGNGGLRCRILESGTLSLGSAELKVL